MDHPLVLYTGPKRSFSFEKANRNPSSCGMQRNVPKTTSMVSLYQSPCHSPCAKSSMQPLVSSRTKVYSGATTRGSCDHFEIINTICIGRIIRPLHLRIPISGSESSTRKDTIERWSLWQQDAAAFDTVRSY